MATADEINTPFKRSDRALGFGAISISIPAVISIASSRSEYSCILFAGCLLLVLAGVLVIRGKKEGLAIIAVLTLITLIQKVSSTTPIMVLALIGGGYTQVALAADAVLILGVLIYCVNRLWDSRDADLPDTPIYVQKPLTPLMNPEQAAEHLKRLSKPVPADSPDAPA